MENTNLFRESGAENSKCIAHVSVNAPCRTEPQPGVLAEPDVFVGAALSTRSLGES